MHILQGLQRHLYLFRTLHFSCILQIVTDPAVLSPPAPMQPFATC
jgi:hypothetical protein